MGVHWSAAPGKHRDRRAAIDRAEDVALERAEDASVVRVVGDGHDTAAVRAQVEKFQKDIGGLREEIARSIVGNREVVDGVLTCLLAGGHALREGVPGLGKTMLVRVLSETLSLNFSRIQFTPDLMPADIVGTTVIEEVQGGGKAFEFRKGPIFANIVLADEVNRARVGRPLGRGRDARRHTGQLPFAR